MTSQSNICDVISLQNKIWNLPDRSTISRKFIYDKEGKLAKSCRTDPNFAGQCPRSGTYFEDCVSYDHTWKFIVAQSSPYPRKSVFIEIHEQQQAIIPQSMCLHFGKMGNSNVKNIFQNSYTFLMQQRRNATWYSSIITVNCRHNHVNKINHNTTAGGISCFSLWPNIKTTNQFINHDDIIKWKHFPRYWPLVRGIHQSPHKGQWRGALMFSLICTRINGWVNNGETGDLRRHHAHYDVTVMDGRRS